MSALFITCGLLAGSNVANAQEYQMQATVSAYHNTGDGYRNDELGGDFTYYFSPVKTAGVPLAEAAFLGHNSNVSAYTFRDINDQDSNGHNIGGEFWFKDLYVDAYSQKNYGQNFYSARVGYMAVSYTHLDVYKRQRANCRAPKHPAKPCSKWKTARQTPCWLSCCWRAARI